MEHAESKIQIKQGIVKHIQSEIRTEQDIHRMEYTHRVGYIPGIEIETYT